MKQDDKKYTLYLVIQVEIHVVSHQVIELKPPVTELCSWTSILVSGNIQNEKLSLEEELI